MSSGSNVEWRDIDHPAFFNLRDVGGYVVRPDRRIAPGKLLRSDLPRGELRAEELPPIGLEIDLRGAEELATDPSPLAELGVEVEQVSLFTGSAASFVAEKFTLQEMYRQLVATAGPAFARVAALVAAPREGAVLVHCAAGKDRTGLAIALILSAVGVERDTVIADYARTEDRLGGKWLADRIAELQQHHQTDLTEVIELLSASPAEVIADVLISLDDEFGGAAEYLLAHGLSVDELDALRGRLVESE